MTPFLREHDLICHAPVASLRLVNNAANDVLPAWFDSDFPLVVRRAPWNMVCFEGTKVGTKERAIPVGIRGLKREQRCAAYLHVAIQNDANPLQSLPPQMHVITPESVVQTQAWQRYPHLLNFAPIQLVRQIAAQIGAALNDVNCIWGVTGSAGFALATGLPVLRAESDLDLVIRAPVPLTPAQNEQIAHIETLAAGLCRVDIQIDTGQGGFALKEWLKASQSDKPILLKTDYAPILTRNPWDTAIVLAHTTAHTTATASLK